MRYFTADTHFAHEGIITMMARVGANGALYNSIEDHDREVIACINRTVSRDDELYILGDFAWKTPGKYRSQIHAKCFMVMGNHDRPEKTRNVFGEVPMVRTVKIFNKARTDSMKAVCCHYPMAYWDKSHHGEPHLYGHCHGQREAYLDALEPQRRAMDVGLDNVFRLYGEYRPLAEWEIFDYMARRSGHDDVRFYDDYQIEMFQERHLPITDRTASPRRSL